MNLDATLMSMFGIPHPPRPANMIYRPRLRSGPFPAGPSHLGTAAPFCALILLAAEFSRRAAILESRLGQWR